MSDASFEYACETEWRDDDVTPEAWLEATTKGVAAGVQGMLDELRRIEPPGRHPAAYDLQAISKAANDRIAGINAELVTMPGDVRAWVKRVFRWAQEREQRAERGTGRIVELIEKRGLTYDDYVRAVQEGEPVTRKVAMELELMARIRLPALLLKDTESGAAAEGVHLDDFYAHAPSGRYIWTPGRAFWVAKSVNARVPPQSKVDSTGSPVLDEDGKAKFQPAANWLDQNRTVEDMTWAPGMPILIKDRIVSDGGWIHRPGVSTFNLYRPSTAVPGDAALADRWLRHIYAVYPEDAAHIISFLAHRVQRPGEKINHALVLGGDQGIGKDTMLEPVKYAVGPWNFSEVSPKNILGRFNGFLKSVVLRISEARDQGEVDRYAFYDQTKTLMASPPDVLRVDEKNTPEHAIFNVCGVIITTNHKSDGIFIDPNDRRHYVAWSERSRQDFGPDYWNSLWRWLKRGGQSHVYAYLATYNLSGFDAKAPPRRTQAFWAMVDSGRAAEDAELADALDALGRPAAVTIADVAQRADGELGPYLLDRANSRKIPHQFERCGYERVRNTDADDGLWRVNRKRVVIYAKRELCVRDQTKAVKDLISGSGRRCQ